MENNHIKTVENNSHGLNWSETWSRGTNSRLPFGANWDDADGNEDRQKNNRFNKQNKNFARASHFFVHFFPVFARLRRENV